MSTAGMSQMDSSRPMYSLSAEEMARLNEIVARLAQSHLPLPSILTGMADDLPAGAMSEALKALGAAVAAGQPLEEALERTQANAGLAASGMIRTILTAKTPSQTLFRIMKYQQERAELRRTFWLRLCYPILLLFSCSLLFGIMMKVVSTQFIPIFRDFGISLPAMTMVVVSMAEFTNQLGWAGILLPPVIAALGLWMASVMINGSLHRWLDMAQFCRTLAELVDAGSPLSESLTICRMMMTGRLAQAAEDMIDLTRQGEDLPTAMELQSDIPEGVSELVRWSAMEGGNGAEGLRVAASLCEARGRGQTRFLSSLFTVLSVLIVSWLILVINLAVFLPLITLISRLSG